MHASSSRAAAEAAVEAAAAGQTATQEPQKKSRADANVRSIHECRQLMRSSSSSSGRRKKNLNHKISLGQIAGTYVMSAQECSSSCVAADAADQSTRRNSSSKSVTQS
eukprot:scaffold229540_cov14-Tisochrysis_lutea.AAC.1